MKKPRPKTPAPDRIDRLADIVGKLAESIAALATAQAQSKAIARAEQPVDYVSSPGRLARYSVPSLVALLGNGELTYTEWQNKAVLEQGMSLRTFERLSGIARAAGLVEVRRESHSFYKARRGEA